MQPHCDDADDYWLPPDLGIWGFWVLVSGFPSLRLKRIWEVRDLPNVANAGVALDHESLLQSFVTNCIDVRHDSAMMQMPVGHQHMCQSMELVHCRRAYAVLLRAKQQHRLRKVHYIQKSAYGQHHIYKDRQWIIVI